MGARTCTVQGMHVGLYLPHACMQCLLPWTPLQSASTLLGKKKNEPTNDPDQYCCLHMHMISVWGFKKLREQQQQQQQMCSIQEVPSVLEATTNH